MSSNNEFDNIGVAIVEHPFSVNETEQPFRKRWGGEYMTFIALDKNPEVTKRNDEVNHVSN